MTPSKLEFKRAKPRLGTLLQIRLEVDSTDELIPILQSAIDAAFAEATRLENIFNYHSRESELAQLNRLNQSDELELSEDLAQLLARATALRVLSQQAFDPFEGDPDFQWLTSRRVKKQGHGTVDLSGLAKGFIVDRLAEQLESALPVAGGVVDAGGDMRFFGTADRSAHIRVGPAFEPLTQHLVMRHASVATSGPQAAELGESSTRYSQQLQRTASVVAPLCADADALTKVALFGDKDSISACCQALNAQVFLFDADGALTDMFGEA